jgi:hypothetical protein
MLLSPMRIRHNFILPAIIISLIWINSAATQAISPDTLENTVRAEIPDSLKQSLWPSLLESAIIPGLGQIRQENPGRAVIFYGASLALLVNAYTEYRDYQDNGNTDAKQRAYQSLALFSQVYLVNLLDVLDTYLRNKYEPWPEELFSDTPLKSPWGAVARSAMLPGWGQMYNEQYVKAVIGIGAFAYFASQIYSYNLDYRRTGDTYYRDKRVVNSWYLGLTYVIVLMDAYVDAYLYKFDETMGISMGIVPEKNNLAIYMGVSFEF